MLENHDEASLHALVLSEGEVENCQLLSSTLGWDAVVGKEHFFNLPLWWSFSAIERGSLLVQSLRIIEQSGFVDYFTKLYHLKYIKELKAYFRLTGGTGETVEGSNSGISPITIHDSLMLESLCLLVYGSAVATLCFFGEILKVILRDLVAWAIVLL